MADKLVGALHKLNSIPLEQPFLWFFQAYKLLQVKGSMSLVINLVELNPASTTDFSADYKIGTNSIFNLVNY